MRQQILEAIGPEALVPAARELLASHDYDFAVVRDAVTEAEIVKGREEPYWLAGEIEDRLIEGGAVSPDQNWTVFERTGGVGPHFDHYTFRELAVSTRLDDSAVSRRFYGLSSDFELAPGPRPRDMHRILSPLWHEVQALKRRNWQKEMSSTEQRLGDICLVRVLPKPAFHAVETEDGKTFAVVTCPQRSSLS